MKLSIAIALAAAKLISAHSTFQSIVVSGTNQGQHVGVQTPSNANNPILDVTSSLMTCKGGSPVSNFISVAAGSTIQLQWHHSDPVQSGDGDEPIAASHHGPIMIYMAKADSSNGQGAVWTKIYEDGLSNGVWAVDKFIQNKGLISITLPNLEDGNYLIRPEIIALHEANNLGKAQFYNGCGQLKITGGSVSLPSSGTDMTKAYSATDPGVYVNIYSGITSYQIPGPAVWNGSGSGSGSGGGQTTKKTTTTAAPTTMKTRTTTKQTTTTTATSACATKYGQCGGQGWAGPTCCASGSTCVSSGDYYSQCQ